eukprot:8792308-Lingulodinium_polyedra.AAC.1
MLFHGEPDDGDVAQQAFRRPVGASAARHLNSEVVQQLVATLEIPRAGTGPPVLTRSKPAAPP